MEEGAGVQAGIMGFSWDVGGLTSKILFKIRGPKLMTWQGECSPGASRHTWAGGREYLRKFIGGRPSQLGASVFSSFNSGDPGSSSWHPQLFNFLSMTKTRFVRRQVSLTPSTPARIRRGKEGRCVWVRTHTLSTGSRSGYL